MLGGASLQYSLPSARPVGARAQLAERGEHQALHAADQQRLRRDRLAAHLLEERRAGARAAVDEVGHVGGREAAEAGLEVPLAGGLDLRQQALGVERVGLREVAEARPGRAWTAGASPRATACARVALALEVVGVDDAHQPEVEEADAAVVQQQVVAGVRVAGRAAGVLERPEEEAEDDLAEAVSLRFVEPLDLLEALARRSAR